MRLLSVFLLVFAVGCGFEFRTASVATQPDAPKHSESDDKAKEVEGILRRVRAAVEADRRATPTDLRGSEARSSSLAKLLSDYEIEIRSMDSKAEWHPSAVQYVQSLKDIAEAHRQTASILLEPLPDVRIDPLKNIEEANKQMERIGQLHAKIDRYWLVVGQARKELQRHISESCLLGEDFIDRTQKRD